jgi:HlyD family secretion protein
MKNILTTPLSKKRYVIFFVILLASILGLVLLLQKPNGESEYTVKREDLINTVLVNGTYTTASQIEVISPAKGIITELFVDNQTQVQKGNPLFRVESTATDEEKASAYSDYLLAKTKLDAANATVFSLKSALYDAWDDYYNLATGDTYENADGSPKNDARNLPEFTTAQNDWLAAEAKLKNQETVVAQAQAAMQKATLAYNATQDITVKAPANGTVVNLTKKAGDQVGVFSASQSQQNRTATSLPVLTIIDFSNPVLVASVNEVNIPRMKAGQKAKIVFDALPGKQFTGMVTALDSVGIKTQGTVTYNARIVANGLTDEVKPNMTASITIETTKLKNVLTVPNNAIIEKDGKTFVQRAGDRKGTLTEIIVGLKGLTKSEVVKGLSVGDRIILSE